LETTVGVIVARPWSDGAGPGSGPFLPGGSALPARVPPGIVSSLSQTLCGDFPEVPDYPPVFDPFTSSSPCGLEMAFISQYHQAKCLFPLGGSGNAPVIPGNRQRPGNHQIDPAGALRHA
jgi:hypothetical protein